MSVPAFLVDLVHRRSGLVIGQDKEYLLQSRLAGVLQREHLPDLQALAHRLRGTPDDALERDVTEAMATHETLFFRDAKPFDHLRLAGLPGLLQARAPGAALRLWSAAASYGQEAYSLAMIVAETGITDRHPVEIVGTDLARDAIGRARAGRFSQYEVQRGLSVHRLMRHFSRDADDWLISPALRAICHFREWNLLDDPAPLGRFDVVFCRNVLIYLDAPTRSRVLAGIKRQLAPGGLLYLGLAESHAGIGDPQDTHGPAVQGLARAG